jgi:nucleoside-diphosphate-sugar epimerase
MACTKAAKEIFDFKPSISLREGMKRTVEWYLGSAVKAGGVSC